MDNQQNESPDPTPRVLDGWVTRKQVAAELSVSIDTLQRWQNRRDGPPCVRVGRKVLYRAEALREWLLGRERTPAAGKHARPGGAR